MDENFSLAKRENNPNRDFIIVNKFQSKHYPSDPRETVSQCEKLGKKMSEAFPEGECLAVVFAETAIGIGSFAASLLGKRCFLISTTRETLPDYYKYISFKESHSHAPLHRLYLRSGIDFGRFSHIFVIDDEYTTGNTAVSFSKAIREYCACPVTAVSFASSEKSRQNFISNGINLITENTFSDFNIDFPKKFLPDREISFKNSDWDLCFNELSDIRLGVGCAEYFDECKRLCGAVLSRLSEALGAAADLEIIGTEEVCLIPVMLGKMLAEKGFTVRVHGVTRSPMLPSDSKEYPITDRAALQSLYDADRKVYIYNQVPCDLSIVITDAENPDNNAVSRLCGACGGKKTALIRLRGKAMKTSLDSEDCRLLLKDITGHIRPLPPDEREPLIRKGVHYCELLPAEYVPSNQYLRLYEAGLTAWGKQTADAVRSVAEKIYLNKGKNAVIVSLARAGTPVGVLIKRYLERTCGIKIPHYSISIIRGKGIDKNALRYILSRHSAENIQFVDGWTGKGAITRQLREALADFPEIDSRLAVLADPAALCEIYGTRDDIFIPCSCLNSVVSGLFSRTVLRSDVIFEGDFHGAAYFRELEKYDRTYEFISAIEREMALLPPYEPFECLPPNGSGLAETRRIAQKFDVSDLNLVKPSIGEATRVLLRRVPEKILVRSLESPLTKHLIELAAEKRVPVGEYPLKCYEAVGIIKNQ